MGRRFEMKIALYLQDYRKNSNKEFYDALSKVKGLRPDLLVFPETCFTPFEKSLNDFDTTDNDGANRGIVEKTAYKISDLAGCAVIVGGEDREGMIFSVYANAFAGKNETPSKIYLKHTMAEESPLSFDEYNLWQSGLFEAIRLSGKKIGMTICYDCNHAAFSRAYGKNNVDILINSTGGNVDYSKWYRYNKVRAVENNCFNFVTMGYSENPKLNSYTYGFTPKGKSMAGKPLFSLHADSEWNRIGNVFVYDTDIAGDGYESDINLSQSETLNQKGKGPLWEIDPRKVQTLLAGCQKVDEGLYVKKNVKNLDLVIAVVENKDIVKPEIVLAKLYNPKLAQCSLKKKYLIINHWNKLDEDYYKNILSDILRVRAMENYCAVLCTAGDFSKCYQTTDNRKSQPVAAEHGTYALDLGRMGGPDVIWKDKNGMRAAWRKGYECLIDSLRDE
jgi:predicted amidohydrolase